MTETTEIRLTETLPAVTQPAVTEHITVTQTCSTLEAFQGVEIISTSTVTLPAETIRETQSITETSTITTTVTFNKEV